MWNPHNIKLFRTFLAALHAPDYNQPILKPSMTLDTLKWLKADREVCGEAQGRFLLTQDTPRAVQVGLATLSHLDTSMERRVLQHQVEHTVLLLWTVWPKRAFRLFYKCIWCPLSRPWAWGRKKYMGHCCPFFSLAVWSVGNCVTIKPTSLLFSTVLVGVQGRSSSLWFSLKNNEFHKYENIMDEFFCFIAIGA